MQKCKVCKKIMQGRKDKKFCSVNCKNYYHTNLRSVSVKAAKQIDLILHRNRSILLELMGKYEHQKKVSRIELEKKRFRFKYLTHFYKNKHGKIYHYVYDFAWMEFSTDEVLILRKRMG